MASVIIANVTKEQITQEGIFQKSNFLKLSILTYLSIVIYKEECRFFEWKWKNGDWVRSCSSLRCSSLNKSENRLKRKNGDWVESDRLRRPDLTQPHFFLFSPKKPAFLLVKHKTLAILYILYYTVFSGRI